jgi:hypothetical protein
MGQGGVVLLTDVDKGGCVVVEPQLECDGSLPNVLLGLITTNSLGFVDKAWDLAPSLKRAFSHTPLQLQPGSVMFFFSFISLELWALM